MSSRYRSQYDLIENGGNYLLSGVGKGAKDGIAWKHYSPESWNELMKNKSWKDKYGKELKTWMQQKLYIPVKGVASKDAINGRLQWQYEDTSFLNLNEDGLSISKKKFDTLREAHPEFGKRLGTNLINQAKEIQAEYFGNFTKKNDENDDKEKKKKKEDSGVSEALSKYGEIMSAAKKKKYKREGDAELVVRINEKFINSLPKKMRNEGFKMGHDLKIENDKRNPDSSIVSPDGKNAADVDFKDQYYFDEFEKTLKDDSAFEKWMDGFGRLSLSSTEAATEAAKEVKELIEMTADKSEEIQKKGVAGLMSFRASKALMRGVESAYKSRTYVIFHDYNRFIVFLWSQPNMAVTISPVYNCFDENVTFTSLMLAVMNCIEDTSKLRETVSPKAMPKNEISSKKNDESASASASAWITQPTLNINIQLDVCDIPKVEVDKENGKASDSPKKKSVGVAMVENDLNRLAESDAWIENKLYHYGGSSDRSENTNPARGVYNKDAQLVAIILYVDDGTFEAFKLKQRKIANEHNLRGNDKFLKIGLAAGCSNVIITNGTKSIVARCYPYYAINQKKEKKEYDQVGGLVKLSSLDGDIWQYIKKICILTKDISYTIDEMKASGGSEMKEKESGSMSLKNTGDKKNEKNDNNGNINKERSNDTNDNNDASATDATPMSSEANKSNTKQSAFAKPGKLAGEYWLLWEMRTSNGGRIMRAKRKKDGKCVFVKNEILRIGLAEYHKYEMLKEKGFGKYLPNSYEFTTAVFEHGDGDDVETRIKFVLVTEDCGLPIIRSPFLTQQEIYDIRDLLVNELITHGLQHNDFAGRNILYDDKIKKITLIDWDEQRRTQQKHEFIHKPMTEEQKKWYYFDENKKYTSFTIM